MRGVVRVEVAQVVDETCGMDGDGRVEAGIARS